MIQFPHAVPPTRHSLNRSLNIDAEAAEAFVRQAVELAADPSARLGLTMAVRQSRPASIDLLLLHCLVRYIHDRVTHAQRIDAGTGLSHTWQQLFPELPVTIAEALQAAELAGVGS